MKNDVIICFLDGETPVVASVDENTVIDVGDNEFLALVDMDGNAYADVCGNAYEIDGDSIKYIKIESQSPTKERGNMQKSTIDKTEETLVDMHVEFENGTILDIDEVDMSEIAIDNRLMTIPEGDAVAHTINLDKVVYITYDGDNYK